MLKIIAAAITMAIAFIAAKITGWTYLMLGMGAVSAFGMMKGRQLLDGLKYSTAEQRNMIRNFEALEIAAWVARPAIYILEHHRPEWVRSEMRHLVNSQSNVLAQHNGSEAELITYLHRLATIPMPPDKAFQKVAKMTISRFGSKRGKEIVAEAFSAAMDMIARVNAPDRAIAWLCWQGTRFGLTEDVLMEGIRYRLERKIINGEALAVTNLGASQEIRDCMDAPITQSMRENRKIIGLMSEIDEYRRELSSRGWESENAEYQRLVHAIEERHRARTQGAYA